MTVESSNQSDGWSCAREALADIRASAGEVPPFLAGVFGQLDHLADDLRAQELTCQVNEREALQAQIDRLALVANELTAAVAGQKQLACQNRLSDRDPDEASSDT